MLGYEGASKLEMRRVELSTKCAVLGVRRLEHSVGRRPVHISQTASDETQWGRLDLRD